MLKRIFLNIIFIFSLYFLPWWAVLPLLIFLVFYLEFFVEALFYALYLDFLFSKPFQNIWDFNFFYFVGVLILLFFSIYLKNKTL
ncbi:hypothetical protein CSB11_02595 [Candidatus Campbellbacteria bacterium]|nr:MAG: hypothetical protein CSB11_02595 [Candidatus Campbellbacteria bacterium]